MNITDFIGKGFNVEQMREIRFGIAANLDIRYFADRGYNYLQMK